MRNATRDDGARGRFDSLTIGLHWLTVLLTVFLGATGVAIANGALALLYLHRSAGAAVLIITAVRFLWRRTLARFPAFPDRMPRLQRWLIAKSEQLIYAILLIQPLTGLAATLTLGRGFQVLWSTVPPLFQLDPEAHELFARLHAFGALGLFILAFGHAAMGLLHHYVWRDDVLATMAPWVTPKRSERPPTVREGRHAKHPGMAE